VRYVKVALDLPLNQLFCYEVPDKFIAQIEIGKRVLVPFRQRRLTGFVVEEAKEKNSKGLRQIINVVDELPGSSFRRLHSTSFQGR